MKVPTVESSCCGLSLKRGTLLIGILAFVASLCAFLRTLEDLYEFNEILAHPNLDNPLIVKIKEHGFAVQIYLYLSFAATAVEAILATILMTGYFTSNHTMLRVWVMGMIPVQLISIVSNTVMAILLQEFIYLFNHFAVCINLYFICVVNSYAQEMIKGSSSSIA